MNNFIDIFPTRVYKFKLNSHEEIKSQYLDSIIQSYEDNLYEVPEDWETNKISTSFWLLWRAITSRKLRRHANQWPGRL